MTYLNLYPVLVLVLIATVPDICILFTFVSMEIPRPVSNDPRLIQLSYNYSHAPKLLLIDTCTNAYSFVTKVQNQQHRIQNLSGKCAHKT